MDDFPPSLTPPNSLIRNQNKYIYVKLIWILTHRHTSPAAWRLLEYGDKCQSGKCSCFCYVGSSCNSVGSDQWLPLQCKLCMNINDAYFYKVKYFFMVMHKQPLYSHQPLSLTFEFSQVFREFFADVWLEVCDILHT